MNAVRGPLVVVAIVYEASPDGIQVDVRGGDREVSLRFHRLGVVPLLEEFARRSVPLVPDLCVPLGDALYKPSEGILRERTREQMDVVWHETQRVGGHVRTYTLSAHQRDKEEIIPTVREQSSTIVSAQDDVMRNTF
jgi:hypothetical protein